MQNAIITKSSTSPKLVQANRRILVIDDNQAIHDDFRKILCGASTTNELAAAEEVLFGDEPGLCSTQEFEVDSADQGQSGLALVQEAREQGRPYAMAFVDMRMPPGWDGVETIEHLWSVDPALQVVICTAYSDHQWDQVTQRLRHSEKLLILRKPFDMIEVKQLADSLTHKWDLAFQAEQSLESLAEVEKALWKALAETESLVASISSILIGLDDRNQIIRWNTASERMFGWSASSMLGQMFQASQICWDWSVIMTALTDCRENRAPVQMPEIRFVDQTGQEEFLSLTASPILKEPGAEPGILLLGTSITKQKALEAQLAITQKMESIGHLAAGVAHEINTPIHYVAENVRFLKESFQDLHGLLDSYSRFLETSQARDLNGDAAAVVQEKVHEVDLEYLLSEIPAVLDQTMEGTTRVAEIVQAMKEFSHPGTGEKSAVDLNRAIQNAVTVGTNEWKDIAEVVTNLDPALPEVPGFFGELNQVLLNLIVNATHAIAEKNQAGTNGKGEISICTRQDGDCVELQVRDTGCGISESIRPRVFDPFFTTKEVGKGTGQGLALVHTIIVQKHAGAITFESEMGKGTTFIVRLPLDLVEAGIG